MRDEVDFDCENIGIYQSFLSIEQPMKQFQSKIYFKRPKLVGFKGPNDKVILIVLLIFYDMGPGGI